MDEDLRVSVCLQTVAAAQQLGLHARVIVEFAVLCGPDRAIFVREWLSTINKADDAQATCAEREVSSGNRVAVVRAAMHDRAHHLFDCLDVWTPKDAADATHALNLFLPQRRKSAKRCRV